jgi:hypothetical protein
MTAPGNLVFAVALAAAAVLLSLPRLHAFELTGAWATSADQCAKVFARKGRANRVDFTRFSGLYGAGFVAEADRLRASSRAA